MQSAILDLAVAIPHFYIQQEELAKARGVEPQKYREGLGCEEMAVCGPGEDTVSLAASAAWRVLERQPRFRSKIGLCVVGTESGVDAAKPVSVYLHRLLGLPSSCRTFEIKHACYATTAALQMAAAWAQQNPHRVALVVASDIARYEKGSAGEPTQGAGAVALLVGMASFQDALLLLSPISGVHTSDVYDFWRPTYQRTALVKGKFSMACYLEGLCAAYEDYKAQTDGQESEADALLFHIPFPGMAKKAHHRLCQIQGVTDEDAIQRDFALRVEAGLWANRKVGNLYSGSLYLALVGLCESKGISLLGQKVALFSYGSGSCSEYFTGWIGHGILRYVRQLPKLFASRLQVDIDTYEALQDEAMAMESDQTYQADRPGLGQPFTYLGIRDHERIYRKNVVASKPHPTKDTDTPGQVYPRLGV